MTRSLVTIGLVATLASTALAQEGEDATAPDSTEARQDVATGEAEAEEAPAEEAEQPEPEPEDPRLVEAAGRIEAAEALYEAGDYDGAMAEFETLYELLSDHPSRFAVLYNMARVEERRFNYGRAMELYHRFVDEPAEDDEYRAAAEAKIESLDAMLGVVRIEVNAARYEVRIDGRSIGENVREARVPGGTVSVEIVSSGYVPAEEQVQVAARREVTVRIELEELAEEYEGLDPVFTYTGAGLAGAALITGGVLGMLAISRHSELANLSEAERRTLEAAETHERMEELSLLADVMFVSSGLLAAATVALAFMTNWNDERPPETTALLTPLRGGAAITATGAF